MLSTGLRGLITGLAGAAFMVGGLATPAHAGLALTVTATVNPKTYDGTTSASVSACEITGGLDAGAPDVGLICTPAFDTGNASATASATVTFSLSGTDAAAYDTPAALSTSAAISQKPITASMTADNKVYNSDTNAVVHCSPVGVESKDSASVSITCSNAAFASRTVGVGKSVTADATLNDSTGNYAFTPTTLNTTADITALSLTATLNASATNREYDRTTSVAATGSCSLTGVIAGDIVTCAASSLSGSMVDKLVGSGKTVTVTGYSLGGADAGNYSFSPTSKSTTVTISQKALTATVTITTKSYDGNTSATIGGCTLNGVIAGDTVNCETSGATATFVDKNAGVDKTVNVTGLTISGADAGNYTLPTSTSTTGTITQAGLIPVTVKVTLTTKPYDGTSSATSSRCDVLSGVVAGDVVTCSATAPAYSAAMAGTTAGDATVTLTGADAALYTVQTKTVVGLIESRAVTATVTGGEKFFDNTPTAPGGCAIPGVAPGETLNCAVTLLSSQVGTYTLTAANVLVTGTTITNYTVTIIISSSSVTIKKLDLTPQVLVNSKVYDGTTAATIYLCTFNDGVAAAAGVYCSTSGATASFDSVSLGVNKPVSVAGLALGGVQAGNFNLTISSLITYASILTAEGSADPLPLLVSAVDTTAYTGLGLPPLQFRVSVADVLIILPTCRAFNGSTPISNTDVEGVFQIVCSGAATSPLYTISYAAGTLRIVPDDGTHSGPAPLATYSAPALQRVTTTGTALVRAQMYASNGTLLAVSLEVPKGAFARDLTFSLSPGRLLPDLLGYTSLRIIARDSSGADIDRFSKPLTITIPAGAANAVPVWSVDGKEWVPIPKLTGSSLPTGAADGYVVLQDGSIRIFTTHLTIFALQTGQPALKLVASTVQTKQLVGRTITLKLTGGAESGEVTYASLTKSICSVPTVTKPNVKLLKVGRCVLLARKAGDRQYFDAESAPLVLLVKKSPTASAPTESTQTGAVVTGTGTWKKITGLPAVQVYSGTTGVKPVVINLGTATTKTVSVRKAVPFVITLVGLGKGSIVAPMIIGPNGVATYLSAAAATKAGTAKTQYLKLLSVGTYRLLFRVPNSDTARLITLRVV